MAELLNELSDVVLTIKSKIEDFLRDYPALFKAASKVYHTFNGSFRTLSKGTPEAIHKAFSIIKNENQGDIGDYYEFGLFRGYAFLKAYEYTQQLNINDIHFYGFDSFKGLPETQGIDVADGRFFEGQFACSKQDVEKNLSEHGMDMSKVVLVEGYYEDSLTKELHSQHSFRPASVVLLDCDLYSSTVEALAWVDQYLQDGTILLLDDYFSFGDGDDLGQPKALQEFIDSNDRYSIEHLWRFSHNGNAFRLRVA